MRENEDLEGALVAFVELMEQAKYFDAHEVLEAAWHPLRKRKDPLHRLVKGIINGAIAFEHLKRGYKEAPRRARRVILSYERYKDACIEEIAYYKLFAQACDKIEQLKREHVQVFDV